jgi:hypothetical protein
MVPVTMPFAERDRVAERRRQFHPACDSVQGRVGLEEARRLVADTKESVKMRKPEGIRRRDSAEP